VKPPSTAACKLEVLALTRPCFASWDSSRGEGLSTAESDDKEFCCEWAAVEESLEAG